MSGREFSEAELVTKEGIGTDDPAKKDVALMYLIQRIWDLEREIQERAVGGKHPPAAK